MKVRIGMTWYKKEEPISGLTNKGHAINGLVVCISWHVSALWLTTIVWLIPIGKITSNMSKATQELLLVGWSSSIKKRQNEIKKKEKIIHSSSLMSRCVYKPKLSL